MLKVRDKDFQSVHNRTKSPRECISTHFAHHLAEWDERRGGERGKVHIRKDTAIDSTEDC